MAFIDLSKKNDVLDVNPVSLDIGIHITDHGSNWLWAAFSVFTLLALFHGFTYASTSFKGNVAKKCLLLVPFVTNFVLSVTYFTYASNLGYTGVFTEFHHVTAGNDVRQIFYVKYIGYFLAWPFSLLIITSSASTLLETLASDNGASLATVIDVFSNLLTKVLSTEVFVLGLLIGSLIESSYKWGYFTFAVVAQLFAMSIVFFNVAKASKAAKRAAKRATLTLPVVLFQLLVWLLYPIAWGLSEGGNVIQPDSEAVFFGVLDLITFSFVPTILTWSSINRFDDHFFASIIRLRSPLSKREVESPRHSGDTAVSPVLRDTQGAGERTVEA